MIRHLQSGPLTARQLSALLRLREHDVIDHLESLARSKSHSLQFDPAECRSCGYIFEDRRRLSKPGKCPRCRNQRIDEPVFRIEPDADG
jgi:predicted Zn-ribbon and HTH transcriptional regulator